MAGMRSTKSPSGIVWRLHTSASVARWCRNSRHGLASPSVNSGRASTASTRPSSRPAHWPSSYINQDKDFHISIWARKIAYAYNYIRPGLTSQQRSDLDAWFNALATWLERMVHNAAVNRFPGRLSDNYSSVEGCGSTPTPGATHTHFNGHQVFTFGFAWDNKQSNHMAAVASIAVTTENSTLKSKVERWFKEAIQVNVYSTGTVWEQRRWGGSTPQTGYNYAMSVVGSLVTIADAFARLRDTELYDYITSTGYCGPSSSTPKGLLMVLRRYANVTLGNTLIYATTSSGGQTSANAIDPSGSGGTFYNDVSFAQANVYYEDALLEQSYTRTIPNTWSTGGYDGVGGDWGNLPKARFMFGQMEGLVSREELFSASSGGGTGQALVGEYLMLNNQDSSGLDNHATFTSIGTDTTNEIEGTTASVINASTDIISIPTTEWAPAASQGTVDVWHRPSLFEASQRHLFGHTSSTTGFADCIGIKIINGQLAVSLGDASLSATDLFQLTLNTWANVVLTWGAGAWKLYVNGLERGAGTYTGLSTLKATAHIGNDGLSGNAAAQGLYDRVRVYNTVRTASEILADYNDLADDPEDPPPDPEFDPLALGTCEIGDVANNQLVCTYTGTPDPAKCNTLGNFQVNDGAFAVTNCALGATLTLTVFPPATSTDTLTLE
jgi:hypothetical protein